MGRQRRPAQENGPFDNNGTNIGTGKTGKYMIDADLNYRSGSNLKFSFAENVTNKAPFIEGAVLDAFVIGTGGEVTSHGTKLTAKLTQNQWTHQKKGSGNKMLPEPFSCQSIFTII